MKKVDYAGHFKKVDYATRRGESLIYFLLFFFLF